MPTPAQLEWARSVFESGRTLIPLDPKHAERAIEALESIKPPDITLTRLPGGVELKRKPPTQAPAPADVDALRQREADLRAKLAEVPSDDPAHAALRGQIYDLKSRRELMEGQTLTAADLKPAPTAEVISRHPLSFRSPRLDFAYKEVLSAREEMQEAKKQKDSKRFTELEAREKAMIGIIAEEVKQRLDEIDTAIDLADRMGNTEESNALAAARKIMAKGGQSYAETLTPQSEGVTK